MLISCPECKAKVSDTAHVCPHCGYPIDSLVKCPECGTMVEPGTKTCPNCGYPFVRTFPVAGIAGDKSNPVASVEMPPVVGSSTRAIPTRSTVMREKTSTADIVDSPILLAKEGRRSVASSSPIAVSPRQRVLPELPLPYNNSGVFSVMYGIYDGIVSPLLFMNSARITFDEGFIATHPDLWSQMVKTEWSVCIVLGLLFAGMGVAILRSQSSRTRRVLVWSTIVTTGAIWLLMLALSASSSAGTSPVRLGLFDFLFIGGMVGSLRVKKLSQEEIHDLEAANADENNVATDNKHIWQYSIDGHMSRTRASTREIRKLISDPIPQKIMVWTEGADKFRPASDYAIFADIPHNNSSHGPSENG